MSKSEKNKAGRSESPTELNDLIDAIRKEQQQINQDEAHSITRLVLIGGLLIKLQEKAERTWTQQVKDLGYHPRTASRLQKMAVTWWAKIGTEGSEIFKGLPADPQKLEWLCRLNKQQLKALMKETDCKKVSRKDIVALVKEARGEKEEAPERDELGSLLKSVNRFFARVLTAVESLTKQDNGQEWRKTLEETLAKQTREIQKALKPAEGPPPPAPASDE